ncbi:hypothetical protein KKH63_01355, partial [Patescibacteria group bacterium]|nr:hypothetical protein [Patescibacteria group bacterium]
MDKLIMAIFAIPLIIFACICGALPPIAGYLAVEGVGIEIDLESRSWCDWGQYDDPDEKPIRCPKIGSEIGANCSIECGSAPIAWWKCRNDF